MSSERLGESPQVPAWALPPGADLVHVLDLEDPCTACSGRLFISFAIAVFSCLPDLQQPRTDPFPFHFDASLFSLLHFEAAQIE